VRESQVAQFVYLGEFGDTFGPGKHTLTTDNIPVLTKIKSWPYGFNSPFKADVYYVVTRLFTGNKWGTSNPVMLRDTDFGIVRVRAFGTYDFKIVDAEDLPPRGGRLGPQLPARRVQRHHAVAHRQHLHRCARVGEDPGARRRGPLLGTGRGAAAPHQPGGHAKYGLEITSFIVENVSVPPEVEQAIDKRSSMAAIGNLNDFVKYQMGKGFEAGGGSAGAAGTAAELAVGFGIAQQMMQQGFAGGQATPTVAPAAPAGASALPELRDRPMPPRHWARLGGRRDGRARVG
jgi:membrane protease subunit (stomatin/prohibitin family)